MFKAIVMIEVTKEVKTYSNHFGWSETSHTTEYVVLSAAEARRIMKASRNSYLHDLVYYGHDTVLNDHNGQSVFIQRKIIRGRKALKK